MFTEQRIGEIIKQLKEHMYPQIRPVTGWMMKESIGECRPDVAKEGLSEGWERIPEHYIWGGDKAYLLFRNKIVIPQEYDGRIAEFAIRTGKEGEWDATNPQFTVYVDRVLRQGFDVNHRQIRLSEHAAAGTEYEVFLSAFTGTNNPVLEFDTTIRTVDEQTKQLAYDLEVPYLAACTMDADDYIYLSLMKILNQAVNLLDLRRWGSEAYYASLQEAADYLKRELYEKASYTEGQVLCIGHTHIDVAWLWTLSVTEDKAVRSFSTVLELMDRYPEYKFMSSQPQLYLYVKKNAPEIYERIREKVREGRWEVEGGMFVEPDCNLTGGESLVRQLLYGKAFFRKEFDKDSKILWLPDVFGYSAALPQILRKSGIEYFMTTKISWNEVNKLPYDTFEWEGIDGTKVLTHFITTRDYASKTRNLRTNNEFTTDFSANYNGDLTPSQIRGAWQRYQQKELNDEVLCAYGFGDGGGGPTENMLEMQRRLTKGIPGCPVTKNESALTFFKHLEKNLENKKTPVWSGELYLEYHRATYTSMARNKRYNRKAEFALMNLEMLSNLAMIWNESEYPQDVLEKNWEILMRNQFHDILPGSSIYEVYEDSKREYETLFSQIGEKTEDVYDRLAGLTDRILAVNPNGAQMSGIVEMPQSFGLKNVQKTAEGTYLGYAKQVPAKGFAVLEDRLIDRGQVRLNGDEIETPFAKIIFNEKGQIISWYDKCSDRELLKAGKAANILMCYEDKPFIFDNWNLFDYYKEKCWEIDALTGKTVVEEGPLRWGISLEWTFLDSVITETIYFYPDTARVDIVFDADWKEDQIFLKALFPLDLNSHEATYEIQYGNVTRPTVYNTSWDTARFEVCCHKWMDIAEGDYGVSFLNDCKYGVSVEDNLVGLSLIKCGMYPNPKADREKHHAIYSVYPHQGSWKTAGTAVQAYLLNNPMQVVCGTGKERILPDTFSLVSCDKRNIMVESVKNAENENGMIVRLYEFENTRTKAAVTIGYRCKEIYLCDLMENKERLIGTDTDRVEILVKPFEIVTLLIHRESLS